MDSTQRFTGRTHWRASTPFFLMHAAAVALPFFTGVSWQLILLCLGSYYLRMFAVTAGYHRYFAHRTYKTGRAFQFVLAFLAQSSAQKGALWWAAHHRDHHLYSDTERDLHSPARRGFWWSHVGWFLSTQYEATNYGRIKDFARFPELVFLNRWYLLPVFAYAGATLALFGWDGLVWGFVVSTVLLWHGTFVINSLAHAVGRRRYPTSDTSRNSLVLALVAMGEGWHNNHHHYPSSTAQGFFWWELDVTFYVLKVLSWLGVVSGLRTPPPRLLEQARGPSPVAGLLPQVPPSLRLNE